MEGLAVLEVVQEHRWDAVRVGGHEYGRSLDANGLVVLRDPVRKRSIGNAASAMLCVRGSGARCATLSSRRRRPRREEAKPATFEATWWRSRKKNERSTNKNAAAERCGLPNGPLPRPGDDEVVRDRRDGHGAGDGDSVRGCKRAGALERENEPDACAKEERIDLGDVDLPLRLLRRVHDRDAWKEPELHGLLRERIGAGDERLRRHDRSRGGEDDHGVQGPGRDQRIERIGGQLRMLQSKRALAEVAKKSDGSTTRNHERRIGAGPEVPHVRVQRASAPVMARTTPPRTKKPWRRFAMKKWIARLGSTARRARGSCASWDRREHRSSQTRAALPARTRGRCLRCPGVAREEREERNDRQRQELRAGGRWSPLRVPRWPRVRRSRE